MTTTHTISHSNLSHDTANVCTSVTAPPQPSTRTGRHSCTIAKCTAPPVPHFARATVLPPAAEYWMGISTGVRNANLRKWGLTRPLWLFGCPHVEYRELVDGF
jgi:hypothetical protein